MIKLFGFGACFGLADPSPFVLKVDAYLRMADIPYTYYPSLRNIKRSPKGKLPFIRDGDKTIADSECIIDYLVNTYGDKLNTWLSPEQAAIAHFLQKSFDEHFYWCLVTSRWKTDEVWDDVKNAMFARLPSYSRGLIANVVRKSIRRALYAQGTGRHTNAEIEIITRKFLDALNNTLGGKPYLLGEQPCSADATAFAFLSELICVPLEGPLNRVGREYPSLVDYCQRIQAKYYS